MPHRILTNTFSINSNIQFEYAFKNTLNGHGRLVNYTKEGFKNDSCRMALSANLETTERASANHCAVLENQFETPSLKYRY